VRTAALARDFVGNVYMPVYWGDLGTTIMRLDPTGAMTLVAGGGESLVAGVPALDFVLPDILGLAIDPLTGALADLWLRQQGLPRPRSCRAAGLIPVPGPGAVRRALSAV